MFDPVPKGRATSRAGTLYAIDGGDSWIYYGQVAYDRTMGFFRFRSHQLASTADVISSEIMTRIAVHYPSVGEAIRKGNWKIIGSYEVREELREQMVSVQWPVGTLDVDVWKGGEIILSTKVHDPEIQDLEIMTLGYDAIPHVPQRLKADFSPEEAEWFVGGPIRRERRVKEVLAKRHPDAPWHQLPPDWVFVER